jgi:hypothetical protein
MQQVRKLCVVTYYVANGSPDNPSIVCAIYVTNIFFFKIDAHYTLETIEKMWSFGANTFRGDYI